MVDRGRVPAVVLAFVALAGPAGAQGVLDHLKCHRVSDPMKPAATADLAATLQPDFSDSGCKIGKARYFCVPATKENVVPPPPAPEITGQPLSDDYVCYRLRCPSKPPDHEVSDQFGTRMQRKYKSSLLCVPARKTGVTTTTTMTTTTTTPGQPPCIATAVLDPDNLVNTLMPGVPVTITARASSTAGGVFDVHFADSLGGFFCPTTGCGPYLLALCGTRTFDFVYTPPASSPPPNIGIEVVVSPHSVPFTCGPGSVAGVGGKLFPVSP